MDEKLKKCPKCGATPIRKMTNEGVPIWEQRERYKVYCPNGCAYGISGGCYEMAERVFVKNALISANREAISAWNRRVEG